MIVSVCFSCIYSATSATSSLGDFVSSATSSKTSDYSQNRQECIQSKKASKALLNGFISGVTGIYEETKLGLEKKSAMGLFKGVARGITGIALKPVKLLILNDEIYICVC